MKTLTIRNTTNKVHSAFIDSVFKKIEDEIRKNPVYAHRIILMTKQQDGTWTVDGTGIEIDFEDISRTDIQHVTIRKEG